MRVSREELKRMIDQIPEQDVLEVYDFIEFLTFKRGEQALNEKEVEYLAKDEEVVRQVQKSREDRRNGRIYSKEQGLKYLRRCFKGS
ncbi:hypothetical protein ESP47_00020 [Heyndrickxia coagulans]|uniref:DUF2281 domain-containing protein n=3 Tax=Bacillaceae TaxID=186817 RepID=G2TQD8_HEYCO|nr:MULTISPECIES: hypothetical protein [Heyndrickxia]AEO99786.1 hypothetical protein Bcoa_0563 [Heyndrickxia coagulans 36D1]KGT37312.1 hypothetical protein P421_16010 [Heyndrickxia coagulans P38]NWN94019.1 hypothetical protein [Bacillus sp. (in: firmicutes)]AJO24072.1 hypothetical protein SB48_HM08orf05248 [Heyndrickxia coagulans]AKN54448.1 hypothetical protein AB434_2043 [Heyndrickxia coagulans]